MVSEASKILIIVEGAKKDYKLMNRAFELFVKDETKIVVYGTNLYELYDRLCGDEGNISRDKSSIEQAGLIKLNNKQITNWQIDKSCYVIATCMF